MTRVQHPFLPWIFTLEQIDPYNADKKLLILLTQAQYFVCWLMSNEIVIIKKNKNHTSHNLGQYMKTICMVDNSSFEYTEQIKLVYCILWTLIFFINL